MLAVSARSVSRDDPLSGLSIGDHPDPRPPEGWATVRVRAASLNHHDVWTLRGVGIDPKRLPMVLGCDAAGTDEAGNDVVVHSVVTSEGWTGDDTLDPRRSLLSEVHDGTLAELVAVPRRNLVPKPPSLSFEEAACLPTAWLTAYRMLFTHGAVKPGDTVLVQGAGGGVATALVMLGAATGYRVWVTSRSEDKRDRALGLGADRAFASGERLPERVDAVFETVGEATWSHSLKSLRPGGTLVVCGATSGFDPPSELNRVYFLQLRIVGSTMGNLQELAALVRLCDVSGLRPLVDRVIPLTDARAGLEALESGDVFGKIVLKTG